MSWGLVRPRVVRWVWVGGVAGGVFTLPACELIVGGDYKTSSAGDDGGGSSGVASSGGVGSSGSVGGSGVGSSGRVGGSGASSGSTSGAAAAFVGTWSSTVTQRTTCMNGSSTSSPSLTSYADTTIWTLASSTVLTAPAGNADPCAAQASVSGTTATVLQTSCSVPDTQNNTTITFKLMSDVWLLGSGGTTAMATEFLMSSEIVSGTDVTCQIAIVGTYTKH
jgi:hypothetical protein